MAFEVRDLSDDFFSSPQSLRRDPTYGAPQSHDDDRFCDVLAPFPADWRGERGAVVEDRYIRVRFVGPAGAPLVLVLGGVSAGRCAGGVGHGVNGVSGSDGAGRSWWPEIVRPGGAIDASTRRIAAIDFFPAAPRDFIDLTTADYADVIVGAFQAIGIDRVDAVVGASFGGMVGLKLAERHPGFTGRLTAISAAHRAAPMARAWRRVQRRVLELGRDSGRFDEAVAIARELAITTYRTPEEFNARFGAGGQDLDAYLEHHGTTYADKMSLARYLTLSRAIDQHNADPDRISIPIRLVAADSDRLVPLEDMRELASRLRGPSRLDVISSRYGHDAFLKETAALSPILNAFLKELDQ